MIKITVNAQNPYSVYTGCGELNKLGEAIKWERGISKVLVVTDSTVEKIYLASVKNILEESGFMVYTYAFLAGEKSKTTNTYLEIIYNLAENKFTREDLVVALGGGVVGDLAGFAASTYMRGIDFVQIPTTLLAAIDASIGGKTGVNLEQGKNLLGAFHQPKLVFCDCDFFKTLPNEEWQNGLGEGIKYGVLKGSEILEILSDGLTDDNLQTFVALCQMAKAEIVSSDETEQGERRLLNLGHTFGHAIEKLSNYEIPHGFAVAKGIEIMAQACLKNGKLSQNVFNIIEQLLNQYELKINNTCAFDNMFKCLYADKKMAKNDEIFVVKISDISKCYVEKTTLDDFYAFMKKGNE